MHLHTTCQDYVYIAMLVQDTLYFKLEHSMNFFNLNYYQNHFQKVKFSKFPCRLYSYYQLMLPVLNFHNRLQNCHQIILISEYTILTSFSSSVYTAATLYY